MLRLTRTVIIVPDDIGNHMTLGDLCVTCGEQRVNLEVGHVTVPFRQGRPQQIDDTAIAIFG